MSNIGIELDVPTIQKMRSHLRELADNLEKRLRETENTIDEVSKTWQDENFKDFKNKFEEDKQKLNPLSKKVSTFESQFLSEIERKLRKYLERR